MDTKVVSMKDGDVMDDSDIVSRFNEIYDTTNKYILTFITAKCGSSSDINDIFQETYMELYQLMTKRGRNYITGEKALVLKIAKQKIARYYSLVKRLRMFVSMTVKNENDENVEIELPDSEINSMLMEDCVLDQIMLENARKYINQKPTDVEKIFYLFYSAGLSIPEIAKELSLSESNVKNKLYRTIKELRNLLTKGGNHNENDESE
jgi:RNA polymerase sigma-70 factor (ECF subfamily)